MSPKKREPVFKDLKSALITFAVIGTLLAVGVLAIDRNNVNRLTKYYHNALHSQEQAISLIEERFHHALTLGAILTEEGFEDPLTPLLQYWTEGSSIEETSWLYGESDALLAQLQRTLYQEQAYRRMAPYFEEMYIAEQMLIEPVEQYNEQVAFYTRQASAFPALLTARRLVHITLVPFEIASALKGRP